eukprot:COSAG02_NODE_2472_length_8743_cov_66.542573_8_plen_66_part_00
MPCRRTQKPMGIARHKFGVGPVLGGVGAGDAGGGSEGELMDGLLMAGAKALGRAATVEGVSAESE